MTLDIEAIQARYVASGLTTDARLIDERLSERLGGKWYLGVSTKKDGETFVSNFEMVSLAACEAIVAYAEDVPALVSEVKALRFQIQAWRLAE